MPANRKPFFVLGRSPKDNRLLAALPVADYERLLPHLELVALPLGQAIYESDKEQIHVFFPTSGIVTMLSMTEDGGSTGSAVVGNEGVVGISVFLGGESTPSRAVVYSAGNGYRLSASVLTLEFRRGGSLQHLLLCYTQALIAQVLQTGVCNRHHALEQQLCRLLLLTLDRSPTSELRLSHELIANMLGVRREGVTEAAGRLKADGLIQYSRGHISLLDRRGLEARACECYAVVKREYERLLPQVPSSSVRTPSSASPAIARNHLSSGLGVFDPVAHA